MPHDVIPPARTFQRLTDVSQDTGEAVLTAEVTALPSPGHTPGHMHVLITSAGERAVLPGDAIVHPAQVSEPEWPFGLHCRDPRWRGSSPGR